MKQFGATRRMVVLWATGLACAAILTVVGLAGLHRPRAQARQLGRQAVPADLALRDTAIADRDAQAVFILGLGTVDPVARGAAISLAQAFGQAADTAWATYLSHALNRPGEAELRNAYVAEATLGRQLGAQLVSMGPTSAQYESLLVSERAASVAEDAALAKLESTIYEPIVRAAGPNINADMSRAATTVLLGFGPLALLFTVVALSLLRRARREEMAFRVEAQSLRAARRHADFDQSLQGALEMTTSEDEIVDVVTQALSIAAPDIPAEMLLADSSHAHFRQVLTTCLEAECGCQVGSPTDCPVATGGHGQVFPDSTALNTCRYLRGRPDKVWAVCVPVNVAGRTIGVIHAQELADHEIPDELSTTFELVARKVGERVGALRVLARTEAQAKTDPLTGLPNRRTLDAKMFDLLAESTPYVVAYADLDHFKDINDSFGHETGDRALRLFARVLRDSVRPRDFVARHGGEEFLVVLPECSLPDARTVAERIRTELGKVLGQATVPPFTVTIGLAASEPNDAFSDVVGRADATMLVAKSLGRDQTLAAPDIPAVADPCTASARIAEDLRHRLVQIDVPVNTL